MIILHAAFLENKLLLWGESPAEATARPVARRGRKGKVVRPRAFPFDAGATPLTSALESAGVLVSGRKARTETAIAWLPTNGNVPVPSSPLIAEIPDSPASITLFPWTVTVLPLAFEEVAALLCMSAGKQTLAPGVVVGRDLAFWVRTMRFAGALVARQRFLPGLESRNGQNRALWEPVLAGEDRGRITTLANDMPGVARALSSEATPTPPAAAPLSILTAFVAGMVDHLVRFVGPIPPITPWVSRKARRRTAEFASLHDQWLHALRSPDGTMEGEAAALAELAGQIRDWHRPIAVSASSPLRLCFRLEEPAEGGEERQARRAASRDAWYVRYLLQPQDDPSLLLPARDAWTPTGRKASALSRWDGGIQEYLLSALGQAAGLCPHIEGSLKTSQPGGYPLDAAGAHEFLTERAVALEQAGFGVMLPAWWTRKGTKVRLAVQARVKSPKMQGGGGPSLGDIIRFDWEVALGDATLTLEELEALARLKAPLVKVRGQWVEVSAGEIREAVEFWRKKSSALPRNVDLSL
jgi:hypothetical protein